MCLVWSVSLKKNKKNLYLSKLIIKAVGQNRIEIAMHSFFVALYYICQAAFIILQAKNLKYI